MQEFLSTIDSYNEWKPPEAVPFLCCKPIKMQTSGIFCGSRLGQDRQVFEKSSHPKSLKIAQKLPDVHQNMNGQIAFGFFFIMTKKLILLK